MMSDISVSIKGYCFSESDKFFLDTNIWFYIYGQQIVKDWKSDVYSEALKQINSAKSRVFIDVTVLSEFVNRYIRNEHEILKAFTSCRCEFKDFKNSEYYQDVVESVSDLIRRVLDQSERVESGIMEIDIDRFLSEFKTSDAEFNDQLIIELCRRKNFKLITHDRHFKNCDVTVLTANKWLLS